jgi:hypothetical protein
VTRALAVNETGEIARKRVERLVNEFRQLITRVIKIEYEILQGEKGVLEEDIKTESDTRGVARQKDLSNIRIDDEHEFWPFTGEYWRDELGYYRYKLLNKCSRGGPEGAPTGGGTEAPVPEGVETPAPGGEAPAPEPTPAPDSQPEQP